jgi:GNAT superfamily N-acetyltransferase
MTDAPLALRPAGPADAEFLYRVYANTRYEELAPTGWPPEQVEAFLRMQFHAQDTHYRTHFPAAAFDIILLAGEPAGRLYVDRRADEIRVVDISLLPEYRGRGAGSALFGALFDEATAAGVPVRIYVEAFNPARRLYDRLGFVQTDTTGVYHLLEWRPPARPA